MTREEAIRKLQKQKEEYLDEWVDFRGIAEAYDMAIEALEKQIPMPVRRTTSTKRCGRCNRQLSRSMNTQPSKRYCARCGQAIDWSDAE